MMKRFGPATIVTALTALVCAVVMLVYTSNTLEGNIDNHVLSARMFGAPKALLDHGFTLFFQGERETGWDGQFYYYIANDPLALRDTAAHLDSNAYRYQRIGFPLVTWVASRLLGQDWVSPTLYYLTNLSVVLLATFLGAVYFVRRGYGPWPVLAWSLSLGVQLTLINGLPDAAADAFLLLALVCHFRRLRSLYALTAAMAALSREAYVLFPLLIAAFDWAATVGIDRTTLSRRGPLSDVVRTSLVWAGRRGWILAIPVVAFGMWQLYVRLKFHVAPSSQAANILGAPLKAWFDYVAFCLSGKHPLFLAGWPTHRELVALLLFLPLLAVGASVALVAWRRSGVADPERPIAVATLILTLLYASFGSTVMAHYTGYMKAAGLFFLVVPFLWTTLTPWTRAALLLFLLLVDGYFGVYLSQDRLASSDARFERYLRIAQVVDAGPIACFDSYDARLRLTGMEDLQTEALSSFVSHERALLLKVEVTDLTSHPFRSTVGAGSVHVSYHWMSADGSKVIVDGIRTALPEAILPGASRSIPLVVKYPDRPGHYILRLSLVQEGCAWFYNANPSSKLDIDYVVR